MIILKKLISIFLCGVLICGNLSAQVPAGEKHPQTLKEYQTRLKQDEVTLAGMNIPLKIFIGGGIAFVAYKILNTASVIRVDVKVGGYIVENYHLNKSFIDDVIDYATVTKDVNLRNKFLTLRRRGVRSGSGFLDSFATLEAHEVSLNIQNWQKLRLSPKISKSTYMIGAIDDISFSSAYILKEYLDERMPVKKFLQMKEKLYANIENTTDLIPVKRLREEIFVNKLPQTEQAQALLELKKYRNAYLEGKGMIYEHAAVRDESWALRNAKGVKGIVKRFLWVSALLFTVDTLSAKTSDDAAVIRIKNNFALFLQADDSVLNQIEKNKELTAAIKVILDDVHDLAQKPEEALLEEQKKHEDLKKQVKVKLENKVNLKKYGIK
ncbi:hypothetical protein Emin_0808 [Elusimicrobium minutum Pei191]|uniref:Uncharacterized protein n=1 Tax=Elusimicrobium minutum (strain Pei191) TaxID=445932 RepID=B2KCW7_ELUMP|nr:hypothetical protein [Elusimicrobium minutum]ACC98363.1 hypothetical protein Emin_0808 [Elusimicrobium minutum Pei191]